MAKKEYIQKGNARQKEFLKNVGFKINKEIEKPKETKISPIKQPTKIIEDSIDLKIYEEPLYSQVFKCEEETNPKTGQWKKVKS